MIGKFAKGLKGFPTPNTAAGTAAYLLLLFDDEQWAQYALGALTALTTGYNWYKAGEIDVDEAAELFRIIVQEAPYNKFPEPTLPDGEPIFMVDENGHIQQLGNDGWHEPDGDFTIPPTPARTEPTDEEKRCLAAANAANALKLVYESLTDSFNAGLATAEAIADAVVVIGTAVSAPIAEITVPLLAIGRLLFQVVYEVVEFISADLWTEAFDSVVQCYLFNCASVADDVVTFDYECFINSLAAQTMAFDLTFTQQRLFGQISYMLGWIGVDGLNAAGATTAIADAECNDCDLWCWHIDFTETDGDFTPVVIGGEDYANYVVGVGWRPKIVDDGCSNHSYVYLSRDLGFSLDNLTNVTYTLATEVGSFDALYFDQIVSGVIGQRTTLSNDTTISHGAVVAPFASEVINLTLNKCGGTDITLVGVTLRGEGANPFGADNC